MANHTVRSTLDNDIHNSRYAVASSTLVQYAHAQVYLWNHDVTWLFDDPLPDIKTRVVTDGRTDG